MSTNFLMNLAMSPYISMVYIRLGEVNVMDLEVGCVRHVSFRRQSLDLGATTTFNSLLLLQSITELR